MWVKYVGAVGEVGGLSMWVQWESVGKVGG